MHGEKRAKTFGQCLKVKILFLGDRFGGTNYTYTSYKMIANSARGEQLKIWGMYVLGEVDTFD